MFHPGDTIGPYTLLRILGRGGFGQVWLAERASTLLTTQVALKIPLDSAAELDAVRAEAKLWLQASGHPNIVPVLDAEVYAGQVVIASEYAAGGTLHDWMATHSGMAPSLDAALTVTGGILAGLDYLHRAGITHRDLKPENVLLQDGIPRLTDFGLARVLKTDGRSSNISGTPRYMAPEAFSGAYSVASDLWSVGVLLHELLSGSHPFPAHDIMGLIAAIQGLEPAQLPETAPERLRAIVARLLAKAPEDRYASGSEVRELLRNCLQPGAPSVAARLPSPGRPASNLPVQPTSFVGREAQIAELEAQIDRTQLLTLTGSGGCGKTRLSLRLAERAQTRFPDGVWFAELARLSDPSLAAPTVAKALGVKETPGVPVSQSLLDALRPKALLLILDNCEHLLAACAELADTITRCCPRVKILATSREALGISGETVYRVPSLSTPDAVQAATSEGLAQYEAVQLFADRAAAAQPGFALADQNALAIARLCVRLDGIPLAIELAAARVRAMAVEQIEARLIDRFRLLTGGSRTALPRQQTLRATVDWSYDLLDAPEKALLLRLSVFAGGWSLEAAETICAGGGIEQWQVLDLLTALVDKSLAVYEPQRGGGRYRLLDTVRHYASDRAVELGEEGAYYAYHRNYFLRIAEEANEKRKGPDQGIWLDRFELDHDNMRRALAHCLANSDGCEQGLRLGAALHWFWHMRGYLTEGRERLADALARPDASLHPWARASALHGAGVLAWRQGDYAAARSHGEESLAIMRALGDRQGTASALGNLGLVAYRLGDYPSARTQLDESLALMRELGDRQGIASSLCSLGLIAYRQGDCATARALQQESLQIMRALQAREGIAMVLTNLGNLAHNEGDFAAARALHQESLEILREMGAREGVAMALTNLGVVACDHGDIASAHDLHQESLDIRRELGDRQGVAVSLGNLSIVVCNERDYASARAMGEESLEIRRELGDRKGIADSLTNLAAVAYCEGDFDAAHALYEESLAIFRDLGDQHYVAYALGKLGSVAYSAGKLASARTMQEQSLRIRRDLDDRNGIACSLESLASLDAAELRQARAIRLWAAAERLRSEVGYQLSEYERAEYQRDMEGARTAMDSSAIDAAWAEGRAMTTDQAVEYALDPA
jgi:predicted ATPase